MNFRHRFAALAAGVLAAVISAPVSADPPEYPVFGEQNSTFMVLLATPDLVIDKVQIVPTDSTKLQVRIKNVGLAEAVANDLMLFYHHRGRVEMQNARVPPLEIGAEQWVVVGASSPISKADRIFLRVDDTDLVTELEEGNNAYVFK